MTQLRVLLIHPHALVRAGLRQMISDEHRHVVFAEAITAEDAANWIAKQTWDVAIVDISAPAKNRLCLLQETLRLRPEIRVLAIHADGDNRYPVLALQMGARGCIHRSASRNELLKAFKSVAAGKTYVDRSAVRADPVPYRTANEKAQLSAREHNVLLAVAAGKRTGEIATEWGLSPKSISTYRRRILDKLHLNSTADLIHYVIETRSAAAPPQIRKNHG